VRKKDKKTRASNSAYEQAGVNIDLAQGLLERVKERISRSRREEVLAPIGGFGGLFQLNLSRYVDPVLVSSIDGVGTKLMIAHMMEKYDTVGYDIVNHCVNDIASQGAEPLYFLDYLGIGRLRSPMYEEVLTGIADACAAQNVAVLGGETAEMPGMYGDDFDLVGAITGVVERDRIIDGKKIHPGCVIIGLASNGLHTNGYSLARKILFEKAKYKVTSVPNSSAWSETVGEALLRPHTCYWPAIKRALAHRVPLLGIAHITGGGWFDNIKRILPEDAAAIADIGVLEVPPVMNLIQQEGKVDPTEMYRVFNMGMGMAWVVAAESIDAALASCKEEGIEAAVVGEIIFGERDIILRGL
jgi:phosphoribosylformylglycinamidine cyclo-ligase